MSKIPQFLAHLPVFGDMPVPFTVTWMSDGKPDFRIPATQKIAECLINKLCGVCGRKLGDFSYLIGGPITRDSRLFTDPPMHRKCAEYSMQTCPFLTGKRQGYSDRPVAAAIVKDENVATIRPSVLYIFKVQTKKVTVNGEGYITARFMGQREYS